MTKNGKTLQKLKYFILENRWFENEKEFIKPEKKINIDELKIPLIRFCGKTG